MYMFKRSKVEQNEWHNNKPVKSTIKSFTDNTYMWKKQNDLHFMKIFVLVDFTYLRVFYYLPMK